jgi:hypothetical protein
MMPCTKTKNQELREPRLNSPLWFWALDSEVRQRSHSGVRPTGSRPRKGVALRALSGNRHRDE